MTGGYPPNRRCEKCGTRYWAEGDRPCPECIRVGDVVRTQDGFEGVLGEIEDRDYGVVWGCGEFTTAPLDTLTLVRRGDDHE